MILTKEEIQEIKAEINAESCDMSECEMAEHLHNLVETVEYLMRYGILAVHKSF